LRINPLKFGGWLKFGPAIAGMYHLIPELVKRERFAKALRKADSLLQEKRSITGQIKEVGEQMLY